MKYNIEIDNIVRNIKNLEKIKTKNKFKFHISIKEIIKNYENKIIINNEIKDFDLNEKEKIIKALQQDKESINKKLSFSYKERKIIVFNEEYISFKDEKDKNENKENNKNIFKNLNQNKKRVFNIKINEILNEIKSPEIETYIKMII